MDTELIVRAWKDPDFRAGLSNEQRAALPDCPAGKPLTELGEEDLGFAIGGAPQPTAPVGCNPNTEHFYCTRDFVCGGGATQEPLCSSNALCGTGWVVCGV